MRKRQIGEVCFGEPCEKNYAGWKLTHHIGAERVELLIKAMKGEELPDGLRLIGQVPGGFQPITREEVKWDGLTWNKPDLQKWWEEHGF